VEVVSDITDYMKERIVKLRQARFLGSVVWALGTGLTVLELLLLRMPFLAIIGFAMLFTGLVLSVHYEFQLLDCTHALENFARKEK
jgi:hypothetical protein